MSPRIRAEVILAAVYTFALPFVLAGALIVQVPVWDAISWADSDPFPGAIAALAGLPLVSACCYLMLRVGMGGALADAALARWPWRQAPLLLFAVLAAVGAAMGLADPARANSAPLATLAIVLASCAAGEWFAHRAAARGDDLERIMWGFALWTAAGLTSLAITGHIVGERRESRQTAHARCTAEYALAPTPEDSAFADRTIPDTRDNRDLESCGDLRARGLLD